MGIDNRYQQDYNLCEKTRPRTLQAKTNRRSPQSILFCIFKLMLVTVSTASSMARQETTRHKSLQFIFFKSFYITSRIIFLPLPIAYSRKQLLPNPSLHLLNAKLPHGT